MHSSEPDDDRAKRNALDATVLDELRSFLEDDATVIEILEEFCDDTRRRIEDLEEAKHRGDVAAMAAQAHAIRGVSETLGAHGLAAICLELERPQAEVTSVAIQDSLSSLSPEFERLTATIRAYVESMT